MPDRKLKNVQCSLCRATLATSAQAGVATRMVSESPSTMREPTTASPSDSVTAASRPMRSSSVGSGSGSGSATGVAGSGSTASAVSGSAVSVGPPEPSADDKRFTLPAFGHVLVEDLVLEQDDALEQRLGSGRAAGHVDVDRDDLVDALGDRVRVPVGAAAVGAAAHGDDVLRVGHLVVEATDGRDHLVGDRAGDDDEVGLAGAGREGDDPEAHDVVAGRGQGRAHLDGAAGETPLERPEGVA